MKTTLVSAVLLAMFAIFATKGYACFCVKTEVSQAYDEAKAVFIGEVTEIVPPRTDDPNADLTESPFRHQFKVEKSWKGPATSTPQFRKSLSCRIRVGLGVSLGDPFLKAENTLSTHYKRRRKI